MANWNAAHGNMLRAKAQNAPLTRLQSALDVMGSDIKEFLKDKADSDAMVYQTSMHGPHFLEDFKQSAVLSLKGRTWNFATKKIDCVEL